MAGEARFSLAPMFLRVSQAGALIVVARKIARGVSLGFMREVHTGMLLAWSRSGLLALPSLLSSLVTRVIGAPQPPVLPAASSIVGCGGTAAILCLVPAVLGKSGPGH